MSKRTHVEDEVQRLRASRAATEDVDPVAPTAAVFQDADRTREPGRGGAPAMARAIDGLHATAGNGAVAWLLGGTGANRHRVGQPQVRGGRAAVTDGPAVQREGDDDEETTDATQAVATTDDPVTQQTAGDPTGTPKGETTGQTTGGEGAVPLGAGAPTANPSWTKVGPPTAGSYSVSGSLRTVATAVGARKEAGSETATPSWQPQTWTPDGGTEEVISAQVTVAQVVELPVWSDKSSATKNQQAEWDRFHVAITTHEAGHVAKDVAAFKGVHSKMLKKTQSDADTELDTVIAQAKTDNNDYDTATASGINQGTRINPNIDEVTKVP